MKKRHAATTMSPARTMLAGLLLILATGLLFGAVPAGADETNRHPANLTLYYPVGTNQDPDIETMFRLSLIYGRVGAVGGVDLNLGVSIIQREMKGLQLTGLYSQVGGDFGGVAMTGLVNYFQGDTRGLQGSGLANVDRGDMTGLQYAGLFNFVEGNMRGAQLTSVFNASHGEGSFLQAAGVANSHNGEFTGLQISGANLVTGGIRGLQLGLANVAVELRGCQAGLVNIARVAHGLQLGAINFARDHQGIPVGLINLDTAGGQMDWLVFGGNLATVGTGIRTDVNRWYSMLWAGYGDSQGDVDETLFFGWNYGYGFRLAEAWTLGVDLGFAHIIPDKTDDPTLNDDLHFALQARALIEYRFSPKVAAYAGGGFSRVYAKYALNAQKETEPNVVVGIALF